MERGEERERGAADSSDVIVSATATAAAVATVVAASSASVTTNSSEKDPVLHSLRSPYRPLVQTYGDFVPRSVAR